MRLFGFRGFRLTGFRFSPQQTWVERQVLVQNSKQLLTPYVVFEIGDFGRPYWDVKSLVQCFKIIVKRASFFLLFLQTLSALLVRKSRRKNKEFRKEGNKPRNLTFQRD